MESLIKAGAFDGLDVRRLSFFSKVEEIVEVTLNRRKDLSLGISTLFAALDEGGTDDWEGTEIVLNDVEWDKNVKLDFEREMLGTYISDHPLIEIEARLLAKTDGTLLSVRENAEDFAKAGRFVTVGGILSEVKVLPTKTGQQYARVTLEDLTGSMEINFSTKKFEECGGYLVKDAIVLIEGRMDQRDDEVRFSAMKVTTLKFDNGTGELRLTFRPEDLTPVRIATLREILARHPGPSAVIVETGEAGKAYKLGPEYQVNIANVVGDLRTEFGLNVIKA
jgi:DNA polymerase-3 subunit alpha